MITKTKTTLALTPVSMSAVSMSAVSMDAVSFGAASKATASKRPHASVCVMAGWVKPVQGIPMSGPARQLGSTLGVSYTCPSTANVAKAANRKDATGDEAFEDPL